jgi:hypothetical protein
MKVWIDKQGGMHYHKADCKMIDYVDNANALPFRYEEIEHQIRRYHLIYNRNYPSIKVDGKWYAPCPMCFGDKRK